MNARAANVADLDQALNTFKDAARPARKSTAETIADQASAIVSRANATMLDEIDNVQKELDELRAQQTQAMAAAEEAIREAMQIADDVAQTTGSIRAQLAQFRSSRARPV